MMVLSACGLRLGAIVGIPIGVILAIAGYSSAGPTPATGCASTSIPTSTPTIAISPQDAQRREARFGAMAVLAGDRDPQTRSLAIRELGRTGDKRAVEALMPALSHYDAAVRAEAVAALAGLDYRDARGVVMDATRDVDANVVKAAVDIVMNSSKSDLQTALVASVNMAAKIRALESEKVVKVQALVDAMKGPGRQREAAAELLAQTDSKEAKEALAEALANPDWRIREAAAKASGRAYPQPVAALAKACSDPSSAVRMAAIESLWKAVPAGWQGHSHDFTPKKPAEKPSDATILAVAALTAELADVDPVLRQKALDGLITVAPEGKLGTVLMPLLNDPDEEIRKIARSGLRGHVDAQQVPELKRLALGEDRVLADAAAEALADIDEEDNLEAMLWLMSDEFADKYRFKNNGSPHDFQSTVVDRIDHSRNPRMLMAGLRLDPKRYARTRYGAADGLWRIATERRGDKGVQKEAFDALKPYVHDPDASIRLLAVKAIASSEGTEGIPAMREAAEDKDKAVRDVAIAFLMRHKERATSMPTTASTASRPG